MFFFETRRRHNSVPLPRNRETSRISRQTRIPFFLFRLFVSLPVVFKKSQSLTKMEFWCFDRTKFRTKKVISCFFLKTSSKFRFRFRAIRLRIECASSRNPIKIWIIHWSRIKGTAQSVEGRRVPFCSSGIGVVVANIASGRQREAVAHGRS